MAKPVFIIGRDRSGTKWLSNIIAAHKEVACVQHEEHSGILEASDVLVSSPVLFGNMLVPENFIAFIECFSETDFFRLTGLNKKIFYESKPDDYFSFFKEMMDRFADSKGKNYWIQKSDVITMHDLYEHFPDAEFIIIIRELKDNLRSKIGQRVREKMEDQRKRLFKEPIGYFIDMAQINKYSNRSNVYVVRYEDLKSNRKSIVENICKFLRIEFDETMLQDQFRKNTSYKNGVSKKEVLTKIDLLKVDILLLLLNVLPERVYEYLYARRRRVMEKFLFDPREKKFLSFKLRKKELGWD